MIQPFNRLFIKQIYDYIFISPSLPLFVIHGKQITQQNLFKDFVFKNGFFIYLLSNFN